MLVESKLITQKPKSIENKVASVGGYYGIMEHTFRQRNNAHISNLHDKVLHILNKY